MTIEPKSPIEADRPSIFDYPMPALREWLGQHGHPSYAAAQLYQWLYRKRARNFGEMTNLSKSLRGELEAHFALQIPEIASRQEDQADGAVKALFRLPDGEGVETVVMPYYSEKIQTQPRTGKVNKREPSESEEYTICLSTQAGCQFGCRFCASGRSGWKRNLTAGEIVAQVLAFLWEGKNITHAVFMGTGEPLHNLNALRDAIDILCAKEGLGLSSRRLTVSTVGLVPEIYRIALEDWKVKLAASLHATTDESREKLMPLARAYQIDQLMDALRFYQRRNGRRISLEYLLIDGVNDRPKDAERMKKLMEGLLCHVNIIPCNKVGEFPYRPPSHDKIQTFKKLLLQYHIDATVRYSRGRNIDAACGQLRLRHE
ncbi:MAG: 23S rRNA (adenine(2503)-C(2))-methyltransferase RlmN [Candidatus Omnitrophota bacterium]